MQLFLNRQTDIDETLHSCGIQPENVYEGKIAMVYKGIFSLWTYNLRIYMLNCYVLTVEFFVFLIHKISSEPELGYGCIV